MKRKLKRFLIFILISFGVLYLSKNDILSIKDLLFDGNKISLNEKDNLVNGNNINTNNYANTNDYLLLVNKNHGLSKNYKPENLTIPNIKFTNLVNNEEKHVSEVIIKPLENLVNEAKNEGIILLGNSGYRSYNSQKNLFNNRVKSQGLENAESYVAKPGFSEHQTGLCIDITNENEFLIQGTKEGDWLENNCHRFGFIIRYPLGKEDITGIEYEPWHIRYVGEEAAKYIYENKITLEEYLEK
ncbi:D-alanyl-D-alanine carboxypeptidase [Clostridium sartagoforme AAU1]|uniref:D-alanyl-D-alanine carboxypeptidase n=1 Tax=Clostridium sartagoforme AAU1 TaxID=1202534 RepID=R9BZV4_9CLOT|nr:D-Ala-D-Ala carboxypeptidase VanY [Clostridium sartagoforme]EOR20486.1 D-alanyl-D-alanine carboxypeptidase [Clostridium sartagoforme AAU1]